MTKLHDELVKQLRDCDVNSTQTINGSRIFGKAADLIETQAATIETQRRLLIQAVVKLQDVRGAYVSKGYARDLIARIKTALKETSDE